MRYLLSMLAAGVLSACASAPLTDNRFGTDTRTTLKQQIMHPEAAANADPVAGMDGRSARAAYERYQRASGETAQQSSIFTRQGQP